MYILHTYVYTVYSTNIIREGDACFLWDYIHTNISRSFCILYNYAFSFLTADVLGRGADQLWKALGAHRLQV